MNLNDITFRGKSKYNNKWIYGCLVKLGKESFSDPDRYGITDKGIPIGGTNACYNFQVDEVVPETVGQYTGLVDEDDIKIFEGDILSIPFEEVDEPCKDIVVQYQKGLVYFSNNYHGWYVRFCDKTATNIDYCRNCLVIGNIYDNPKLMEVGSNDRN